MPALRIAGACSWDDERTLRLVLRYIESPRSETWVSVFDEDDIAVTVMNSFAPPPDGPTLVGALAN